VEEPAIADSARRHGIGDDELLHAYNNPIRIWHIGPDTNGDLLEVGVSVRDEQPRIVHGMRARMKFLR